MANLLHTEFWRRHRERNRTIVPDGTAHASHHHRILANLAELTDIDALVAAVHQAALDDGLPALDALRTRAAPREHYRIADGDPAYGFVA